MKVPRDPQQGRGHRGRAGSGDPHLTHTTPGIPDPPAAGALKTR